MAVIKIRTKSGRVKTIVRKIKKSSSKKSSSSSKKSPTKSFFVSLSRDGTETHKVTQGGKTTVKTFPAKKSSSNKSRQQTISPKVLESTKTPIKKKSLERKEITKEFLKKVQAAGIQKPQFTNTLQQRSLAGETLTTKERQQIKTQAERGAIEIRKREIETAKGLAKGVALGLKEIFIDPVVGSFNYGRNLVRRAEKQGTGTLNVLNSDLKKIATGAKNTAVFVKNNPIQSAILVGAAAQQGAGSTAAAFRKDPAVATGKAIAFLFPGQIFKGAKGTVQIAQRISPKYVKEVEGVFKLKKKGFWSSTKDFLKGPKKELPKQFAKNPDIILKKQTVKSGALPLAEQAKFAGKEVTAVNAAANQITSWIGRKKLIRKPIPGEDKFPANIKKLLKKFDSGTKLTKKEFALTNKWLKKNVAPNITLLERSLYLDPASGLRVSRLGIEKQPVARLRDIFKGQFQIRSNKPQVLIFENAKVARFPKNLKDVQEKLKAGKKLNEKETNRLIEWQVKTGSGKFKPIGSTIYQGGRELEVTLAPGEFIKRIKRVGFTFIEGKKVNFVTAEVYKPTKAILNKVNNASKGKLSKTEIKTLEKDLSKKLGRKVKVDTPETRARARPQKNLPLLRVSGKNLRIAGLSKIKRSPPTPRRKPSVAGRGRGPTPPPKRGKTPKRPLKTPPRKPVVRPPKRPTKTPRSPPTIRKTPRTPPSAPPSAPPRKPRAITKLSFDTKLPRGERLAFNFKYRRKGKVIERSIKLPENRALKFAVNFIKRTPARSFELVAVSTTKVKDINKPNLKDFNIRKTKKALLVVEKAKSAGKGIRRR